MLHDEVVNALRSSLIEGRIKPGARVPERALCVELGISRTPLREALKVLAAEGHVVLLPNRGARAARLTRRDLDDLFEVNDALEALAGELACRRITDDGIAAIVAMHRDMAAAFERRDLEDYYRANRAIHEAILAAAGNQALAGVYESVGARIRRARFVAPMPPGHWEVALLEHEAMLNALKRRDGAMLGAILKTHLKHKREEIERAGFAEE
jgi:DNA-binding GntR family transcriptional regulator